MIFLHHRQEARWRRVVGSPEERSSTAGDSPVKPANDEEGPANDEEGPADDEEGPADDGL